VRYIGGWGGESGSGPNREIFTAASYLRVFWRKNAIPLLLLLLLPKPAPGNEATPCCEAKPGGAYGLTGTLAAHSCSGQVWLSFGFHLGFWLGFGLAFGLLSWLLAWLLASCSGFCLGFGLAFGFWLLFWFLSWPSLLLLLCVLLSFCESASCVRARSSESACGPRFKTPV